VRCDGQWLLRPKSRLRLLSCRIAARSGIDSKVVSDDARCPVSSFLIPGECAARLLPGLALSSPAPLRM
jgi:hypothetical protein